MTATAIGASTLGSVAHVDGLISRLACARARKAGIALAPLLAKANLTVEQIDDSRVRLPARDQIDLLNLVADALPDDLLGVHVAQQCDLREMGLLYYVLASSETVIEALRRAVRYAVLVNEGVLQQCIVGRQIRIAFKYVGISRHLDRHQSEFWMLLIVRVLRQLTGLGVSASRVRLVHARQKTPRELAPFLGRDIRFGASVDEISFAGPIGSARVIGADPYLNKHLIAYYEDALCSPAGQPRLVSSLGRERDRADPAARRGPDRRGRAPARAQPTDAGAATERGRPDLLGPSRRAAARSRRSLSRRRRHFDFADRMAARLSGSLRVLESLQAMDRQGTARDALGRRDLRSHGRTQGVGAAGDLPTALNTAFLREQVARWVAR